MNISIKAEELYEIKQNIHAIKGESTQYLIYEAFIGVLYRIHSGKYNDIINSCTKALNSFSGKPGVYPSHYLFFLKNKGIAETAIDKYQDARNSFTEAEKYAINKPYNYYMICFYKTLNELHAGNYLVAYEFFLKNKRCKIEEIKEQFIIIEAYLYFLVRTGFLQINKIFRIGKYLNETLKAQEDKRGDNINILIAELIVYLVKDKNKFMDCVESIKHYSYRHLRGEETERARWFLKILCMIAHPKVNFHPVALKRRAKKYIDLLQDKPKRVGENFAVEIIPFDHLLDMIIEKVMKKAA